MKNNSRMKHSFGKNVNCWSLFSGFFPHVDAALVFARETVMARVLS